VDFECAFTELEILGVEIDPVRKARTLQSVAQQRAARKRKKAEEEAAAELPHDHNFAMIIGYTSGGAPYGISWEEWEEI
jgi:hypothetical protein